MSTGAIIGIVIAVIVVVAIAVVASTEMRRARLRRQFGPEYDRLVEKHGGNKRKADAELADRERRVRGLSLRELTPEQQARYSGDWAAVQERFVDSPAEAVGAAHTLIWNVMRDRGYPADDRSASMDALAVHHGRAFEGYRKVQAVPADSASTEQLRESMIHYRALFEDLTGLREGQAGPQRDRVAEIRDGSAGAPAADRELASDRELAAENRERAAENRDAAARERDLAAEDGNRTADTPR
jgi:hypothetical protein